MDRAEKLVKEVLSGKEESPPAAAASGEKKSAKGKKKAQAKVDISSQDHFPALGGAVPKNKNSASSTSKGAAWAAKDAAEEETVEATVVSPMPSPMKGEAVDSAEEMEVEYKKE